jgi:asparagine synthase (glutamine-hydrolysing)
MCNKLSSIVGTFSKRREIVADIIIDMLGTTTTIDPDRIGICVANTKSSAKNLKELDISGIKSHIGLGYALIHTLTDYEYEDPITSNKKHSIVFDGDINNAAQLVEKFELQNNYTKFNISEILLQIFELYLKKFDLPETVGKVMKIVDGNYSFAIVSNDQLVLTRDPIGTRPIFIGKKDGLIAFASERKALWILGITENIRSLKPGYFVIINKDGISDYEGKILEKNIPIEMSFEEASKGISDLLLKSVENLTKYKKLGALFSGGLDSYLITHIVKNFGMDIELFCCGFKGSRDIINATESARMIDLPLQIHELTLDEIETHLPRILYIIEDRNPLNLSIAIPIFFSTRLAKEHSFRILLSGQGSDEIFGGYAKYENIVKLQGYPKFNQQLYQDIIDIAEQNLQRDTFASLANGVEIRSPFLNQRLINYAIKVPPEYKIRREDSGYIRKFILRSIAKNLGVPTDIADRVKIAIQYGSDSWKALQKLAKKNGFTVQMAHKKGYEDHVQMYVDSLSQLAGIS